MEKEIKFTESKVEAEIPAEQPSLEQNDASIEQEPFNAEEILTEEKRKLGEFELNENTKKIARAFSVVSSMVEPIMDKEGADSQKI